MQRDKKQFFISIVTVAVLICITLVLVNSSKLPCAHKYSAWSVEKEQSYYDAGLKKRTCLKCEKIEFKNTRAEIEFPQVFINGDLLNIGNDNKTVISFEYCGNKEHFRSYATARYQGHTSLEYVKKNYMLKLFEDEECSKTSKISINGWKKTHKVSLKANYTDFSQSRNVVANRIWKNVVESRHNINPKITEMEFSGSVDGFPCMLFINGNYEGLYSFMFPKDDKTYNIADEYNEAMFVINDNSCEASLFKGPVTTDDKEFNIDLEYCYGDNKQWAYDSLNRLIEFINNNSGEDFKEGISYYLDVDSAIDYLIVSYFLGCTSNFTKDMIFWTFDSNRWTLGMFDLGNSLGLVSGGSEIKNFDEILPEILSNGKPISHTESVLWNKLLELYQDEIKTRYFELRDDVLSNSTVKKMYSDYISSIPSELYKNELKRWPDTPLSQIDHLKQITEYIDIHTENLDTIIHNF